MCESELKRCSKCKEWKPFSEFRRSKSKKDGFNYQCKVCDSEWRESNLEKIKEVQRKWRENNLEKIKEVQRKYRENNLEKDKERHSRYHKNNPEVRVRSSMKRQLGGIQPPEDLVQLKTQQLLIKRQIKEIKKCKQPQI